MEKAKGSRKETWEASGSKGEKEGAKRSELRKRAYAHKHFRAKRKKSSPKLDALNSFSIGFSKTKCLETPNKGKAAEAQADNFIQSLLFKFCISKS